MSDSLHWLDVQIIAEELADAHPDVDPIRLSFPQLKKLVEQLPDFEEQPGHPCNERILETIQGLWIKELQDMPHDDDEQ